MIVGDWLKLAVNSLNDKGIGTARLDALVLLEDVSGINRAKLLAEPDRHLSSAEATRLKKLLKARLAHQPLAYVRGHSEFYGYKFAVSPSVLVPRPESETIIDTLKELQSVLENPTIADVGTGSGALGIVAKIIWPTSRVDLLEIDDAAIKVARQNVFEHGLDLTIIKSDLLASGVTGYDMLICNLPYVPNDYPINQAAKYEPELAIFGGVDGLDLYKRLFLQIKHLPIKPRFIITESLPAQHGSLNKVATESGYKQIRNIDFVQLFELDNLVTPV